MTRENKIRVSDNELKELKSIKELCGLGSYGNTIAYLIKKYERAKELENIINTIHIRSKM